MFMSLWVTWTAFLVTARLTHTWVSPADLSQSPSGVQGFACQKLVEGGFCWLMRRCLIVALLLVLSEGELGTLLFCPAQLSSKSFLWGPPQGAKVMVCLLGMLLSLLPAANQPPHPATQTGSVQLGNLVISLYYAFKKLNFSHSSMVFLTIFNDYISY